jgi:hypothetical protein
MQFYSIKKFISVLVVMMLVPLLLVMKPLVHSRQDFSFRYTKSNSGNGGTVPVILNLAYRWRSVVTFTPQGKSPIIHS